MELVVAVMLFLVSGTHHAPPIQEGAFKYDSKREFSITQREVKCLETNLWFEARSECFICQIAINKVVINRVNMEQYANNICGVIYEKKQFSWVSNKNKQININNKMDKTSHERIKLAIKASILLEQLNIKYMEDIIYYHTTNVLPYWAKETRVIYTLGSHSFRAKIK